MPATDVPVCASKQHDRGLAQGLSDTAQRNLRGTASTCMRGMLGQSLFDQERYSRTADVFSAEAMRRYVLTVGEEAEALAHALRQPNALIEDRAALREATHSLIGTAGLVGFQALAHVMRHFEHAIDLGALDVMEVAEAVCETVKATLETIRFHLIQQDAGGVGSKKSPLAAEQVRLLKKNNISGQS